MAWITGHVLSTRPCLNKSSSVGSPINRQKLYWSFVSTAKSKSTGNTKCLTAIKFMCCGKKKKPWCLWVPSQACYSAFFGTWQSFLSQFGTTNKALRTWFCCLPISFSLFALCFVSYPSSGAHPSPRLSAAPVPQSTPTALTIPHWWASFIPINSTAQLPGLASSLLG